MKASNLFWGFFLITIGSLFLVTRYTNFYLDWHQIWDLWPFLLIFIGISVILKGTFVKPMMSALMGILLGLLIFGFFYDIFGFNHNHKFEYDKGRNISNKYFLEYEPEIKHVNVDIEAGAGNFYIQDTTDKLIDTYSNGNIANYEIDKTTNDSIAWLNIDMEDFEGDIFESGLKNEFAIKLNTQPSYNFFLKIGAANSSFDLRDFNVKKIDLETGAANTTLKIGDKSKEINIDIEMGAATLKILIPKKSGCKISGDMVLMTKDFEEFSKLDSDFYQTTNYETAEKKIIIYIEGGVSSFEIEKY